MRVILLQDIDKLGKRYDIKEVADGYARNFLIPQKMAKLASEKSIKWAEEQKTIEVQRAEEDLKRAQGVASEIDGREIIIPVRVGEEGQLFESVTIQKICDKLRELGLEVKKDQVDLAEPIKELGEFPVKIHLEHNLEAEVKAIVVEEK